MNIPDASNSPLPTTRLAALFVALLFALGGVPSPVGADGVSDDPDDPDGPTTVDLKVAGVDHNPGDFRWFNLVEGAVPVTITVENKAGALETVDEIGFRMNAPATADMERLLIQADTDPDGWTHQSLDTDGDGSPDGIKFTASGTGGIVPGGATKTVTFTLETDETVTPGWDESRWDVFLTKSPGLSNSGVNGYTLGIDPDLPTLSVSFDDGTGNTDPSQYHSETGAAPAGLALDAADLTSGIQSVTATHGGIDFTELDCTFTQGDLSGACTIDLTDIPEGSNDFAFTITDLAGNSDTESITVRVDRTAAVFQLTQASFGANGNDGWYTNAPTVTTTFLDPNGPDHAGVSEFMATWTGALDQVMTLDAGDNVDVTPIWVDGISTVTLTGSDDAHSPNDADPDGMTIKLDTTSPMVSKAFVDSADNPLDEASYHSEDTTNLEASFTAQDQSSGLASFTVVGSNGFPASAIDCLAQNGAAIGTTTAQSCIVDLTGIPDGTHTLTATATDVAGTTSTQETLTVRLDHVTPTSGDISSAEGTAGENGWFTSAPTALFVTPTDDRSGLARFLGSWSSGETYDEVDPTTPLDVTPILTDGTRTFTYHSEDKSHPANEETDNDHVLKVDSVAPSISNVALDEEDRGDGLDCSDAHVDAGTCELVDGTGDNAGVKVFNVQFDAADATSGITRATLLVERPYDLGTFVGESVLDTSTAPLDSIASDRLLEYVPNSDGDYTIKVRVQDEAGLVTESSPVTIVVNSVPASQALTRVEVVASVADAYVETEDDVLLTLTAMDTTDPADPTPATNIRVKITDEQSHIVSVGDAVTDANGSMTIHVSEPEAVARTYTIRAHCVVGGGPNGCSEFVIGPSSTIDVTWTGLVLGTPSFLADANGVAIDATGRDDTLTVQVPLTWAHDGSAATGLLDGGQTFGILKQGNGAGASDDLVPDAASSATLLLGSTTDLDDDGTYEITVGHDAIENLDLVPGGLAMDMDFDDAEINDLPTTFTVPSDQGVVGQWIGVVAGACGGGTVQLQNLDDTTDPTPGFVNEDDTIRATIPVCTTKNYDQNNDHTDREPALGATLALFVDHVHAEDAGTLTATDVLPATNGEAFLTCTDGDVCDKDLTMDGTLTLDINKALLGRADVAGSYRILALPTSAPLGATGAAPDRVSQSVSDVTDVTDHGATMDLTFTGVATTLVSIQGAEDVTADRVWLSTGPDLVEDDSDAATITVQSSFAHDGSMVPDASGIGLYCPTLTDSPCTGLAQSDGAAMTAQVAGGAGEAVFTVDPDVLGIDYLPTVLRFQVTDGSALEPGDLTGTIDHAHASYEDEFLWTRIHLEPFNLDSDDEGNIGSSVDYDVYPVWYHDEDGDGFSYHADGMWETHGDGSFHVHSDFIDAADLGAMRVQLADAIPAGDTLMVQSETESVAGEADLLGPGLDGVRARFAITRGCDSLPACANPDINDAGHHRFTPSATNVPHGIATDEVPRQFTHLWTAVALDANTDRLTQEAESGIEATVQAYYAHDHEFVEPFGTAGSLLTLPDRVFPYDVTVSFVEYGDGAGPPTPGLTVPGETGAYTLSVTQVAAGHRTFGFEGTAIQGQTGQPLPLSTIHASPAMERVWLEMVVEGAWDETRDTVTTDDDMDWNDDGDAMDLLFSKDVLALRDDDVELRARLFVDDGVGRTAVEDTYTGYAFTAVDTTTGSGGSLPSNLPGRTTSTTAASIIGQTDVLTFTSDETTPLVLSTGTVGVDTGMVDFDATDCVCWTATIPAPNSLKEDVPFDVAVNLQVTQGSSEDMATRTSIQVADAFEQTYTGILLSLVTASAENGLGEMPGAEGDILWSDWDREVTYTVYAQWAHDADEDGQSYIGDATHIGVASGDAATVDVTLAGASGSHLVPQAVATGTDGQYAFTLAATEAGIHTYGFLATAADDPSTDDDDQDFTDSDEVGTNTLTARSLQQTAYFTGLELSLLGTQASIANVNEGITLDYEARWLHDDTLVLDGITLWDFGVAGGPTHRGVTSDDSGSGAIALTSTDVVDAAPIGFQLAATAPHGITATLVPGDADHDALAPDVTWTRIGATTGTPTVAKGALLGESYTNPDSIPDADVFDSGAIVVQPATFRFDHNDWTVPTGSLASIGGVPGLTSEGASSAAFTSVSEGWFLLEARGRSATLTDPALGVDKVITAAAPATNWIGFDTDKNGNIA